MTDVCRFDFNQVQFASFRSSALSSHRHNFVMDGELRRATTVPGVGIEDQRRRVDRAAVEHVIDRTGRGIEGATADTLTIQPIVLDELRD
jgi:hypothetical protein